MTGLLIIPIVLFQSTCPARGTTRRADELALVAVAFQSTCPARGTTVDQPAVQLAVDISIHVPREGHDGGVGVTRAGIIQFQSTCPARGTTVQQDKYTPDQTFQSTCPARGTTIYLFADSGSVTISIHVPREGHDINKHRAISTHSNFNPRAPRGARPPLLQQGRDNLKFQSTCPARGTTSFCVPLLSGA